MGEEVDVKTRPDTGALNVEVAPEADSKVALDIDDAPFLQDKTEEAAPPATTEDTTLAPVEDEAPAAPSKKKRLIIFGGLLGVLLVAAGAVWWFFFRTPPPSPGGVAPTVIQVPSTPKPAEAPEYLITFAPFWVELPDEKDGVVFLVCKFSAITRSERLAQESQNKMPTLRDAVYYYLKNKPYSFLVNPDNVATIKSDLGSVLSGYLSGGKIDDMLFESYLGR